MSEVKRLEYRVQVAPQRRANSTASLCAGDFPLIRLFLLNRRQHTLAWKSSGRTRDCLGCPVVAKPLIQLEITPPSSSRVPPSLASVCNSLDRIHQASTAASAHPSIVNRCPGPLGEPCKPRPLQNILTGANGSWRHRRHAFITDNLEMQAQPVARERRVAVRSGLKREPLPTI